MATHDLYDVFGRTPARDDELVLNALVVLHCARRDEWANVGPAEALRLRAESIISQRLNRITEASGVSRGT